MVDDSELIAQTRRWLQSVVVANNFCPFAAREMQRDSIRYRVEPATATADCLLALAEECLYLDRTPETETTLILFPAAFADFDDYLDFVAIAEDLLLEQGYEGTYQLASFHPDYLFGDSDAQDPANYTNRSPMPMLHLLRESSIERALADYPGAEAIPQRNIETARRKGLAQMRALLASCLAQSE